MKHLLFASLLIMLTACGGGSSSSMSSSTQISTPTPVNTPPTPRVVNQSVGGLWNGATNLSTAEPASIKVLVSEDGRFFSYALNTSNDCADLSTGNISVAGNVLSGSVQTSVVVVQSTTGCQYSDGTTFSTSTITGSVEQQVQLNVTLTTTTSAGNVLASESGSLNYDNLYSEASSLDKINANWTTPEGDTLSINVNGQLTGQQVGTGCILNGQVSLIDARYNAYTVTLTYGSCNANYALLNGAEANGLAYVDDTKNPVVLVFGYKATTTNNGTLIVVSSVVKQ